MIQHEFIAIQGILVLDGVDISRLHDERDSVVKPL